MNLSKEEFEKLDPLKVGDALLLFSDQVVTGWDQSVKSNIDINFPKSVVVSGMGGSSNAAKIIQSLYESDLKVPFIVHNDYGLPGWVDSDTLVVANSYSGNTEETLSSIESAKKVGAKMLGVCTGGKLAEMIKSGEIQGTIITPGDTNPTGFPKTGLGISFGGLVGILAKTGIVPFIAEDLKKSLEEIEDIRKSWEAEEMAKYLDGYLPVLFGSRPLLGSLNAGRNAMCEISRNFTQFYDFPEVNHVLIEAMQKPDSVKNIKYVFFESEFNNERVKLRYQITQKILEEQGSEYKTYQLKGKSKLTQALELPCYCAWVGYCLSILQNTDPGPEPGILKLKESLSQPVH